MRWNLTKESGRPLHKDQRKWDKEKQESVLIDPQKKEVDCLVKTYGEHSYPTIMTYVLDRDCWVDYDSDRNIPYHEVEKWQYLSHIDDMLEGKPEPMWCFEFGSTLADTAIPALKQWIEKGVSYHPSMSPDAWRNILTKIKQGFEVSLSDLDGGLDNILDLDERKRILEEHDAIRKEAFALMAEYYLDLWD